MMNTAPLERPTGAAVAPLGAVAWRIAYVVAVATSPHSTPARADTGSAVWLEVVGDSWGSERSPAAAADRPARPSSDSASGPVPPLDTFYLPDSWDREAEKVAAVAGRRGRHAAYPVPGARSSGQLVVLFATAGGLLAATAFLVSAAPQARAAGEPASVVGQRRGTA